MRTILIIDDLATPQTDEIMRAFADVGGCRLLHATPPPARLPSVQAVLAVFRQKYGLAPRECDLLLAQMERPSASWADIAKQMTMTRKTVKVYFQRMYRKLGVSGRPEMCMLFRQYFPLPTAQLQVREVGRFTPDEWVDVA